MRKGVSPLIATVLLISITVVLGIIIFTSGSEFLEQLSPAPYCGLVAFKAGIYAENGVYNLEVDNTGTQEIQGFEITVYDKSKGQVDTQKIDFKLESGKSGFKTLSFAESISGKEISITPIVNNVKSVAKPCEKKFGAFVQVESTSVPPAPIEPGSDPVEDPAKEEPSDPIIVDPIEEPVDPIPTVE